MARPVDIHDRGTRFTNYSSIHSADAFVGDYQVMYTPGSASPQNQKQSAVRKPSRFSRAVSASKNLHANSHNNNINNQSYLLPANMPNTSQILPDAGILPLPTAVDGQLIQQYAIPADEKQIVASLRSLQRDFSEAMQRLDEVTRERDEALHEIRLLRATSRKPSSPTKKQNTGKRVEEELFDLSRSEESLRRFSGKKSMAVEKANEISDNARVLSPLPANVVVNNNKRTSEQQKSAQKEAGHSKPYRKPIVEDTEQSMVVEDPTAASNTSRRRHHRRPSFDDNMTSAYILPDITEQQGHLPQLHVSKEAQHVLHSLEPEHIANCDVCRRLTSNQAPKQSRQKSVQLPSAAQLQHDHRNQQMRASRIQPSISSQQTAAAAVAAPVAKIDYTAQALGFLTLQNLDQHQIGFSPDESIYPAATADATIRPKIAPTQALARVRILMNAQFLRAKERHNEAWKKYDGIEAPMSSRRHAAISKEMRYWAEKMEECRVHLDYLRDVEEGVADVVDLEQ